MTNASRRRASRKKAGKKVKVDAKLGTTECTVVQTQGSLLKILPTELFDLICTFVDFKTAISLAHTCKKMRSIIYPSLNSVLFRDVEIDLLTLTPPFPTSILAQHKKLPQIIQRLQRYAACHGYVTLQLTYWLDFRHVEKIIQQKMSKRRQDHENKISTLYAQMPPEAALPVGALAIWQAAIDEVSSEFELGLSERHQKCREKALEVSTLKYHEIVALIEAGIAARKTQHTCIPTKMKPIVEM